MKGKGKGKAKKEKEVVAVAPKGKSKAKGEAKGKGKEKAPEPVKGKGKGKGRAQNEPKNAPKMHQHCQRTMRTLFTRDPKKYDIRSDRKQTQLFNQLLIKCLSRVELTLFSFLFHRQSEGGV